MPTYIYETIVGEGETPERFEIFQKMSDDALEKHPETGQPVKRVIVPVNIGGTWTQAESRLKSDKGIARAGLTKYVKTDDGRYEKTAGDGPSKFEVPPKGQ